MAGELLGAVLLSVRFRVFTALRMLVLLANLVIDECDTWGAVGKTRGFVMRGCEVLLCVSGQYARILGAPGLSSSSVGLIPAIVD